MSKRGRLLNLWSGVVICNLHSDLACVFALAMQCMPKVGLPSTRYDDIVEMYPPFANKFRLLVVIEYRDL
jgi:hypothetical protein